MKRKDGNEKDDTKNDKKKETRKPKTQTNSQGYHHNDRVNEKTNRNLAKKKHSQLTVGKEQKTRVNRKKTLFLLKNLVAERKNRCPISFLNFQNTL